jgi:hypothetical protein
MRLRRRKVSNVSIFRAELRALARALRKMRGEVQLTQRELQAHRVAAQLDRQLTLFPINAHPSYVFCEFEDCDQPPNMNGLCDGHNRDAAAELDLDQDPRRCVYEDNRRCDEPPRSSGYCAYHERVIKTQTEARDVP